MPSRRVVLCADDYAMTDGVSRGILELAELGRISATSAMTTSRYWPVLAEPLRPFRGHVGIGLHLTLTFGSPLAAMPSFAPNGAFPPLAKVVQGALLGNLPLDEIKAEIGRQLDSFTKAFGHEPDFVDGHQHVHALPGIRRVLVRALIERGLKGRFWLRDPADRLASILRRRVAAEKALVVGALSAGFARHVHEAGFATNGGFSGFSAFEDETELARDFDTFLSEPGPRPLVMCHPGYVDDPSGLDDLVGPRARELAFLKSPRFSELLQVRNVSLVPAPV